MQEEEPSEGPCVGEVGGRNLGVPSWFGEEGKQGKLNGTIDKGEGGKQYQHKEAQGKNVCDDLNKLHLHSGSNYPRAEGSVIEVPEAWRYLVED